MASRNQSGIYILDDSTLIEEGKDSLNDEVWVFDDFGQEKLNSLCPIQLDMSIFALCLTGSATLHADLNHYTITPNCLISLTSGNIIEHIDATPDGGGLFVGVSRKFVDEIMPDIYSVLPLIIERKASPITKISDSDSQSLQQCHALLWRFIKTEKGPYRKQIVQNVLRTMLYKVLDIYRTAGVTVPDIPHTRNDDIFFRFTHQVERDFKHKRSVQYYAQCLCITPKHLSSVIKTVSGQTASAWINNYVILAAKVMLRTTTKTIQEISNELNFPNQSFFGKYFKQHTGLSPQAYRVSSAYPDNK